METYISPEILIIGILGLGFALGWFVCSIVDTIYEMQWHFMNKRKHEKQKEKIQNPKM